MSNSWHAYSLTGHGGNVNDSSNSGGSFLPVSLHDPLNRIAIDLALRNERARSFSNKDFVGAVVDLGEAGKYNLTRFICKGPDSYGSNLAFCSFEISTNDYRNKDYVLNFLSHGCKYLCVKLKSGEVLEII